MHSLPCLQPVEKKEETGKDCKLWAPHTAASRPHPPAHLTIPTRGPSLTAVCRTASLPGICCWQAPGKIPHEKADFPLCQSKRHLLFWEDPEKIKQEGRESNGNFPVGGWKGIGPIHTNVLWVQVHQPETRLQPGRGYILAPEAQSIGLDLGKKDPNRWTGMGMGTYAHYSAAGVFPEPDHWVGNDPQITASGSENLVSAWIFCHGL